MKMTPTKFVAFFVLGFAAMWALDSFGLIRRAPNAATAPTKIIVLRPSLPVVFYGVDR
jgi:hypothetical protein